MPIISISLPESLLDTIDRLVREYGYMGRSEFIREALREYMVQKHSEKIFGERGKIYGILIALTNHELKPSVDEKVIETVHSFQPVIRSFYHQLIEGGLCLNIVVLEAYWGEIRSLLNLLRRIRGVEKTWFIPVMKFSKDASNHSLS